MKNIQRERVYCGWALWLGWTAASSTGVLGGLLLAHFFVFLVRGRQSNVDESEFIALAAIVLVAILLSVLQWLVLRVELADAFEWLPASAGGWGMVILGGLAFSWLYMQLFGESITTSVYYVPMTMGWIGAATGVSQWSYLRTYEIKAVQWVTASVVSWLLVGFAVGIELDKSWNFIVPGLVVGVITGWVLSRLLCRMQDSLNHKIEEAA